jgi:hypothetical protein
MALKSKFQQKNESFIKNIHFIFHRNTRLIILANNKPVDVSYEFRASFVEPAIVNVDKQQDFTMKISFSSKQSYSELIILKIIDEEKNGSVGFVFY